MISCSVPGKLLGRFSVRANPSVMILRERVSRERSLFRWSAV
jgi:hypothetical protein